jgi:hypothetical protein
MVGHHHPIVTLPTLGSDESPSFEAGEHRMIKHDGNSQYAE